MDDESDSPAHSLVDTRQLRFSMVGRRSPTPVILAECAVGDESVLGQCAREQLEQGFTTVPAGFVLLEKQRDDLVYICIALRKAGGDKRAKEFVEALPGAFAARIGVGRAKGATRRFAFNAEFSPTLRRLMERHDPAPGGEAGEVDAKLRAVNEDLESAKGAVQRNIDLAVDRSQKLAGVHAHAEVLADSGKQFRQSASALQRQAFWQGAKTKIMLSAACVSILVLLVLLWRRAK
jgi:hypothetical protein